MTTATAPTTKSPGSQRARGRGLFLAGVLLAVVAIGLVFLQLRLKLLIIPWYLPILTSVGVLLVLWSLARRVGVVRIIVLVLLVALAGFEWFSIAVGGKLPEYKGSVQAGKGLPPFRTTLADGGSFTDSDLQDGRRRVLTFFRGRW